MQVGIILIMVQIFLAGSKAIQERVKQSDVKRLFVIGGAESLCNAEGIQ
jgi:putative NADH-flavin reductase